MTQLFEALAPADPGYLVALLIALVGWFQQSAQRRKDERILALELKRTAYSETVGVLYDYVENKTDRIPSEFWTRFFGLALVAPAPVVAKVLNVTTVARDGLTAEEELCAIWQLLDSMRNDLGHGPIEELFEHWSKKGQST